MRWTRALLALLWAGSARAETPEMEALKFELRAEIELPKEGVALAESALVGFGAGHFYAEQPAVGGIFAAAEALGVAMAVGGYAAYDPNRPVITRANGITAGVGVGVFALARALDIGLAPISARRTARERVP